jgi:hypothetical protein
LGSLQGGPREYYHFTSADYAKIANWDTAYGWGDHAGLYDAAGTAAGEVGTHESTYDHSLLHSPVTLDALTGITLTGQQLSYTAGYAIPTTAKQAEWDSAYTHKTTEDAINGLVSCDGSGAYTAKVIGTDVQAYDADLTAIAALTPTDSNIIVGDGSTWVAESGATARTSLGLGTTDSPTFAGLTVDTDTLFVDSANHRIGVGTTAPAYDMDISASQAWAFRAYRENSPLYYTITSFSDSPTDAAVFTLSHVRGTLATPTTNVNGDRIGWLNFQGYQGSGVKNVAAIQCYADGEWGTDGDTSDAPSCLVFLTATDGSATMTEKMRIRNNGYLGIGTTTPREQLEVTGKIRANTAFNLNGTDGVTQVASAGTVCDVTALAGGIATAQTQITYALMEPITSTLGREGKQYNDYQRADYIHNNGLRSGYIWRFE